jgi:hypothetical protein
MGWYQVMGGGRPLGTVTAFGSITILLFMNMLTGLLSGRIWIGSSGWGSHRTSPFVYREIDPINYYCVLTIHIFAIALAGWPFLYFIHVAPDPIAFLATLFQNPTPQI